MITLQEFQWFDRSNTLQSNCIRYYGKKQTLRSRVISIQKLHWEHFSRSVLGLCFLTTKKEDNRVKLRQLLVSRSHWKCTSGLQKHFFYACMLCFHVCFASMLVHMYAFIWYQTCKSSEPSKMEFRFKLSKNDII